MIPVNTPLLAGNEKKYLNECIETGWISSEGPFVSKFESEFSNYVERDYGVAVSNGTAALDIAMQAIDLKPGDEVLVPTFCIISPASAVVRQGAIPVFVDCEPGRFNMEVGDIEKKISSKTKAVIVAHIYNFPADMDPILELCDTHGLVLIEDAAELIGAEYKTRKCGSFGQMSTFSFYPNKHITTGEGGMICTNDSVLAERCRSLRNLCFEPARRFYHEEIGWNYRLTNLQAALGLAQLENIDAHLSKKSEIGLAYNSLLKDLPFLKLPEASMDFGKNSFWVYPIVLEPGSPFTVDDLQTYLGEKKIGTRPFFYPLHLQPVFKTFRKLNSCPNAENIYDRGCYIPSGLGLSQNDIEEVASEIRRFVLRHG